MPRAFKLYLVLLTLWGYWAIGRIDEQHALIPVSERVAAGRHSWQTLAP